MAFDKQRKMKKRLRIERLYKSLGQAVNTTQGGFIF